MAKTNFRSVDDYIASQPEATQTVLKRVRSIIRKALPAAEEVISYQIPAYKLRRQAVVYFAGWKQHYSLYPASAALVKAFKTELAPYELSKGTIRFPLGETVPAKLIEGIANSAQRKWPRAPGRKHAQLRSGSGRRLQRPEVVR